MSAILDQLGLDYTFFVQFAIFAVLFFVLSNLYFKPFMKLFEARHKRTVQDRQAAEKLMEQANSKFEEFKHRMTVERAEARKEYDRLLGEARAEEEAILAKARGEAKKITTETAKSASDQRVQLKKQLADDVEELAQSISTKLTSGRE